MSLNNSGRTGVIKPSRKELLNIVVGRYADSLKAKAKELNDKIMSLDEEKTRVLTQKNAILERARQQHDGFYGRLQAAMSALGGNAFDRVEYKGNNKYLYSCTGSVHMSIGVENPPNLPELDNQMDQLQKEASRLRTEQGDLVRQANNATEVAFFKLVLDRLPTEAGELLDQLCVMIRESVGPVSTAKPEPASVQPVENHQ